MYFDPTLWGVQIGRYALGISRYLYREIIFCPTVEVKRKLETELEKYIGGKISIILKGKNRRQIQNGKDECLVV